MTEKLAARPGMTLAKIGGLIIAATVALILCLSLLASGLSGTMGFFLFLVGALTGGILVIVGFVIRLFAALENR